MMNDLLSCSTCSKIFNDTARTDVPILNQDMLGQDSTLSLQSKKSSSKKTSKLIQNYKEWQFFLITWKRCELLKLDWGRRKVGTEKINTTEIFSRFK